ncbi:leucine-rich repeat protein [uncultured Ruminococcus sp.]|uniref:leucine-rich repeat protein n=1 Tax=uncultured Ruminococcus sp. TaxID=165186 RepID=UPI0025CC63AF|nr:leucine-rich repeat protein [uncultured Ruminococcus sp.]
MKKAFFAVISAAVLAFQPCCTVSYAAAEDFALKYEISDEQVSVTGCTGNVSTLSIPSEIEGLPVTSVADGAFAGNADIITCTIPDSVKTVGAKAFSACPELESITLGKGLSDIGDYAFTACPALTSINVGRDNPTYSSNTGSLYKNDTLVLYAGISHAIISDDTKTIGKGAFFGRSDIKHAIIPPSVTSIEDYAFSGCLSLTDIDIPDSVASLGKGCFMSCSSLERVSLGNYLKAIPEDCFHSCNSLKIVNIAKNITSIGDEAFYSCTSLESLYIPPSVTSMGKDAAGRKYDVRSSSTENIPGFVIRAKSGSAAEKYAAGYGIPCVEYSLKKGDINDDCFIDAIDAALVLMEYARISSGMPSLFGEDQKKASDWNSDGLTDAVDASGILKEYARLASQ